MLNIARTCHKIFQFQNLELEINQWCKLTSLDENQLIKILLNKTKTKLKRKQKEL